MAMASAEAPPDPAGAKGATMPAPAGALTAALPAPVGFPSSSTLTDSTDSLATQQKEAWASAPRAAPAVSADSPAGDGRPLPGGDAGATFARLSGLCARQPRSAPPRSRRLPDDGSDRTPSVSPLLFGRPGGLPPPPEDPGGSFGFLSLPEPEPARPRAASDGGAAPSPEFSSMRIGESRAWSSVTSLRRSDGRLSNTVVGVAVFDSDPQRLKITVATLRDAASDIGANIARALAVEGFATSSACRRRMDERGGPRFRLVLCDGGDVGQAISAAAGIQGIAVVAVQAPCSTDKPRPRTTLRTVGGPLTPSLAHELLWAHALPHGPCPVSGTKPVTSALKLADGVGASLRAGGLRGLLMLMHAERRERAKALDRLLDQQTSDSERRTPCVLVVDDSAVARKLHVRNLQRALTALGCAGDVLVEEACDGQQCCAMLQDDVKNRQRCVVLCLLDLAMPIMGGCAAARRLRAAGATAPVVAVTAAALPRQEFDDDMERASLQDLDDNDDAIALAFDDVISKPFAYGDALSAVERWVLPRLHRKRRGDSPGRMPRSLDPAGEPSRAPAPTKRRRKLSSSSSTYLSVGASAFPDAPPQTNKRCSLRIRRGSRSNFLTCHKIIATRSRLRTPYPLCG